MSKKSFRGAKKPLPIIRYLLYLLIVTTTVTGVSLSRYATSSSGEYTARIAELDIEITPAYLGSNRADMPEYFYELGTTGQTRECLFTVTNNSEVAVRVRLAADSELPVVLDPDWVALDLGGSAVLTADVPQGIDLFSNDAAIHVEYEQID